MAKERQLQYRRGTKLTAPPPDRAICDLADRQYGVIARRQLAELGVTPRVLHGWVRRGRLVLLHRGVYAVGHEHLRREGRWLAAVLAVPGSVLSHRDAAGLYGLRPANHEHIDVTGLGVRSEHRGIRIHRTTVLDATDLTSVEGIPVTTVARTLVDLAGVVSREHLAKTLNEAEHQRVLDVHAIHSALDRTCHRRGPGHANLRQALAELAKHGTTLTRSPLEDAFLKLLRASDLPRPKTNVHIEDIEVDAYWPDRRLIVELDGWDYHRSHHAFQRDRRRDALLTVAGYTVLRFVHADVVGRPAWVARTVGAALASSPPRATMSGACP